MSTPSIHIQIAVHALIIAGIIVFAAWGYHLTTYRLGEAIRERTDRQFGVLTDIALLTDRNGADAVVESIITDCPNRAQFEQLLGNLVRLKERDLLLVQQLFESCGGYFAERKAIMVSRLEREFALLEDTVALGDIVSRSEEVHARVSVWGELVALERERSNRMNEQVTIQRDIIAELLLGSNVLSADVRTLIAKAQDTAEELSVLDNSIDALRSGLLK